MAKKVKFPLDMGNDVMVRSIEELKENYNAERVTEYFLNGKLLTWLEDRYYDEAAEQVRELSEQSDSNPAAKLGAIFGIETEEEVDVEALEIRREKLEKLRKITADDEIIKNVDFVAFSQEELGDLLDEEAQVIYLCGESFYIPLSVKNVRYVGVNDPVVTVSGKGDIDLEANDIVIERCELSEDTKARIVKNTMEADNNGGFHENANGYEDESDENITYTSKNDFEFKNKKDSLIVAKYIGNDKIVKIPEGVNQIGQDAFLDCTTVEKIIIPNGVTRICRYAFYGCKNLKYISLPNTLRTIEGDAFDGCESLESITIPDSVTEIYKEAFRNCGIKSIIIPYGITTIESNTFAVCDELVNVDIPDSVTEIKDNAFWGCSSLKTLDIPDSVTEIKDKAFYGCRSLETLYIPDSVFNFGAQIFGDFYNNDLRIIHCGMSFNVDEFYEFVYRINN